MHHEACHRPGTLLHRKNTRRILALHSPWCIIGELTGGFSWIIDVRHLIIREVLPVERLFETRSGAGSRLAQSTPRFAP
ncbi:hypothetical protein, partial [Nitrosococcus oceani]|uniref:hypothetical protein n=1 Tax=Nitrosococcus oceani TaxID=1229 RepID=UPI001E62EDFC